VRSGGDSGEGRGARRPRSTVERGAASSKLQAPSKGPFHIPHEAAPTRIAQSFQLNRAGVGRVFLLKVCLARTRNSGLRFYFIFHVRGSSLYTGHRLFVTCHSK
jgi:hypothetical protein